VITESVISVEVNALDRVNADPSVAYLLARLAVLEARVRAAVARRRATDADPNDRFRGLYISDAQVDELLAGNRSLGSTDDPEIGALSSAAEDEADAAERSGATIRLRSLGASFDLDSVEIEIFLIALAPDLDPRFERLYAYLQDDVSRRRASTGLALELVGGTAARLARERLTPAARLVAGGLLVVEDTERPFLTRALRVPDRVTAHLLGDDHPDPRLDALIVDCPPVALGETVALARSAAQGVRLWYIRERFGSAGMTMAVSGLTAAGLPPIGVDFGRLAPSDDIPELAAIAAREARLHRGSLVAGPIEALAERGTPAVRAFGETASPTVLLGSRSWDPAWSRQVPVLLEAVVPTVADRNALWFEALDGDSAELRDPASATMQFRLNPEQIVRAARAARQQAQAEDRAPDRDDLHAGARAQNAAGLDRLARRIQPAVGWSELVLPDLAMAQLHELTERVRHRDRVYDEWGMGDRSSKGRGLTALFAGDSGTGKTISAEVVAHDLGLDLYVIDLSTVVDKYIGETEKNLDRIFAEADRVNGVLLFDEADAIFGKRSDVKDARDRYANIEIAYLLQRMELFDGVAILTTNLRANLDEAFLRRLDVIVDFPMPEADDRRRLWELHLRLDLPKGTDIDFAFLASAFKLSGGNIRNICLAAAFFAAADGGQVTMADVILGTEREYQKLGRLTHEAEFGKYDVGRRPRER
jgi:hypothetical protein